MAVAALVSPVRMSHVPTTLAVRTSSGPCSSTGPAAVSWRQNESAVELSASNSVSGARPPPLMTTSTRPL